MSSAYFPIQPKKGWECSICLESDPKANVVAHAGEGKKHPFHKSCIDQWPLYTCPNCRIDTSPYKLKISKWLNNPLAELSLGTAALLLGSVQKKAPLLAIGLALQALGIHQATNAESSRIQVCQKIAQQADEVLSNYSREALDNLKRAFRSHSRYAPLEALLDFQKKEDLLVVVHCIKKRVQAEILNDQIIRVWKGCATIGALYFACRSIASRAQVSSPRIFGLKRVFLQAVLDSPLREFGY